MKKTELFLERRSIRKYKPEKVKKEDLDPLGETGDGDSFWTGAV